MATVNQFCGQRPEGDDRSVLVIQYRGCQLR
jgi:hypothetical protein